MSLLKQLDSRFCTATGVSADWGIICCWFLRLFDVASHDIAKSRAEIDCMIETLDAVFLEGRVFRQVLGAAPGAAPARRAEIIEEHEPVPNVRTDQGVEVGFITGKVMRNMRHKYVFRAGGVPVLLWGEPPSTYIDDLLARVQNIASLTKERLIADFPRNDIRSAMAMFDRRTIVRGYGPQPLARVRSRLLHGVRTVAALLGCEEATAVLQYNSVLPFMLERMAPGQPLAEVSNQAAWASLLSDETWAEACPRATLAASGALRKLIRFYISIEDGECTVERDLGELRALRQAHMTSVLLFLRWQAAREAQRTSDQGSIFWRSCQPVRRIVTILSRVRQPLAGASWGEKRTCQSGGNQSVEPEAQAQELFQCHLSGCTRSCEFWQSCLNDADSLAPT